MTYFEALYNQKWTDLDILVVFWGEGHWVLDIFIWLCLLVLPNNIKFRKRIFMQPDIIINENVNQVEVKSSSESSAPLRRPGRYGCCCIVVWLLSDLEAPNFMTDYRIITRSFMGKTRRDFQLKLNTFFRCHGCIVVKKYLLWNLLSSQFNWN
jgi:hypothetical protein